jgi:hypothetical protein
VGSSPTWNVFLAFWEVRRGLGGLCAGKVIFEAVKAVPSLSVTTRTWEGNKEVTRTMERGRRGEGMFESDDRAESSS